MPEVATRSRVPVAVPASVHPLVATVADSSRLPVARVAAAVAYAHHWQPAPNRAFPGHVDNPHLAPLFTARHPEALTTAALLDVGAVLAGRKPAAGVSRRLLDTPVGAEVRRRGSLKGLVFGTPTEDQVLPNGMRVGTGLVHFGSPARVQWLERALALPGQASGRPDLATRRSRLLGRLYGYSEAALVPPAEPGRFEREDEDVTQYARKPAEPAAPVAWTVHDHNNVILSRHATFGEALTSMTRMRADVDASYALRGERGHWPDAVHAQWPDGSQREVGQHGYYLTPLGVRRTDTQVERTGRGKTHQAFAGHEHSHYVASSVLQGAWHDLVHSHNLRDAWGDPESPEVLPEAEKFFRQAKEPEPQAPVAYVVHTHDDAIAARYPTLGEAVAADARMNQAWRDSLGGPEHAVQPMGVAAQWADGSRRPVPLVSTVSEYLTPLGVWRRDLDSGGGRGVTHQAYISRAHPHYQTAVALRRAHDDLVFHQGMQEQRGHAEGTDVIPEAQQFLQQALEQHDVTPLAVGADRLEEMAPNSPAAQRLAKDWRERARQVLKFRRGGRPQKYAAHNQDAEPFIRAYRASMADWQTHHAVFADWLADHNDPREHLVRQELADHQAGKQSPHVSDWGDRGATLSDGSRLSILFPRKSSREQQRGPVLEARFSVRGGPPAHGTPDWYRSHDDPQRGFHHFVGSEFAPHDAAKLLQRFEDAGLLPEGERMLLHSTLERTWGADAVNKPSQYARSPRAKWLQHAGEVLRLMRGGQPVRYATRKPLEPQRPARYVVRDRDGNEMFSSTDYAPALAAHKTAARRWYEAWDAAGRGSHQQPGFPPQPVGVAAVWPDGSQRPIGFSWYHTPAGAYRHDHEVERSGRGKTHQAFVGRTHPHYLTAVALHDAVHEAVPDNMPGPMAKLAPEFWGKLHEFVQQGLDNHDAAPLAVAADWADEQATPGKEAANVVGDVLRRAARKAIQFRRHGQRPMRYASDETFRQHIHAAPHDRGPRLAYADWLEEQGRPNMGEAQRLAAMVPIITQRGYPEVMGDRKYETPGVTQKHWDGFRGPHVRVMRIGRFSETLGLPPSTRYLTQGDPDETSNHAYIQASMESLREGVRSQNHPDDPTLEGGWLVAGHGWDTFVAGPRSHRDTSIHYYVPDPDAKDTHGHLGAAIARAAEDVAQDAAMHVRAAQRQNPGKTLTPAEALHDHLDEHGLLPRTLRPERLARLRRLRESVRRYAASADAYRSRDPIDAQRELRTRSQEARRQVVLASMRKLGLQVTAHNALHDSPAGSAATVLLSVQPGNSDALRTAAAWYGQLTRRPGAVAFAHDPEGPDAVYGLRLPGTVDAVRQALDAAGLRERVLVPHGRGGVTAVVHDPGRKLRERVAKLAEVSGADVTESIGRGQYVGAGAGAAASGPAAVAADARAAYRDQYRSAEAAARQ